MSSGITFSGFNNIDFNAVLTAIMTQESQPLTTLQTRQSALQTRINNFSTLSSRISSMQSSATALSTASGVSSFKATSSDSSALGVSAGSSAVPGRYDIVVKELARAQVTASASVAPDADTTAVATGGTLTIGGQTITLTGSTTLKGLSDAINANADMPARAAVVQSGANSFKLVLTGKNTGESNSFTITNALSGGSGVNFTDTDNDGVSGDDVLDNAVQATDADLLINNIAVKSASNTLDSSVPGSSITLYKKDPLATIVVDVTADPSALKSKLQSFVSAYNSLVQFVSDQAKTASTNDGSIGRDPVVRQLRNQLRTGLTSQYATGGAFSYLAQIGVETTTAGTMQIKDSVFNDAVKNGTDDVAKLLAGTTGNPGALSSIADTLKTYTQSHGSVSTAQDQLNAQILRIGTQITRMSDQLAVRRTALQAEFTAADAAMSRLKNQSGSLANVSTSL